MHERVINNNYYRPQFGRSATIEGIPSSVSNGEAQHREHFFSPEWLDNEIKRVKREPQKLGETPWYEMKGTGFWVDVQAKQFLKNLPSSPVLFPDALELELSKIAVDVRHFEREYLQQHASLEWKLHWEERDGKKRVVCSDYVGSDKKAKLWQDVTSKDERDGVVFDTLFGNKEKGIQGVEEKLEKAPDGSIFVMVSPKGWSGYDGITYPESQVYVIQKESDALRSYTVRYDATLEQNEALQRSLGQKIPPAKSERARIKNMIANVAIIEPDQQGEKGDKAVNIHTIEDVVTAMQKAVGGREDAYTEGDAMRTFSDIKRFIQNPHEFEERHETTETLLLRLKQYLRKRIRRVSSVADLEKDIKIAMALTPLHLNKLYRHEEIVKQVSERTKRNKGRHLQVAPLPFLGGHIDYQKELVDLQNRPGCAGGGSTMRIDSMGDRREATLSSEQVEGFTCPKCHYSASSIGGDVCPGCGLTKQDFAAESGISCD